MEGRGKEGGREEERKEVKEGRKVERKEFRY